MGDHLKWRRLQRNLLRRHVAPKLGINTFTLGNGEHDRSEPKVLHHPATMGFLGYCPYHSSTTFGKRLMLHRTHRGLSRKALARAVRMDPRSMSRWETETRIPNPGALRRLAKYFGMERI